MRNDPSLVNLLCCPTCRGSLQLQDQSELAPDDHIMSGELRCTGCDAHYPIIDGVPRFLPKVVPKEVSATVGGFGYEWNKANPIVQNTAFASADVLLDFIHPIQPDYFKDKIVLDAGCGLGRFTRLAREFGSRVVVGVDLSDAVRAAFENTRAYPEVLVIQADLFSLPLRQVFDYVFCVGVLHHTINPSGAFDSITSVVKPGGGVSAWVYGRENNEWIVRFLNPIRRHIATRLPHGILRAAAYLITLPMYLVLKGFYRPVGRSQRLAWLRKRLFYFDYLFYLSRFNFHEQALIVFDHLVPTIAEYIAYEEFIRWFRNNGLQEIIITSRAGNSWRGFGIRPL